jgi:hypothetical protein
MSKNIDFKNNFNEDKLIKTDIIEGTADTFEFPKYTTQLINLANKNSQATRPKIVGQMSDLIVECPNKSYEGWKKWYIETHPNAIEDATSKAYEGVIKLREAINLIDKEMVENWVTDLVITKTAEGLIFQEAIIKHLAEKENKSWRLANPHEESKGIDGFIGDKPIQIKSVTYANKDALIENIPYEIIYYENNKNSKYLKIYY